MFLVIAEEGVKEALTWAEGQSKVWLLLQIDHYLI